MPSTRLLTGIGSLVALAGFAGVAAAQTSAPGAGLDFGTRIAITFGVTLVINLLLGGALVAFGPRYAANAVGELRDDPGTAFVWGLIAGIAVPIVLVILAITIVGLIVTIPGFILLAIVGIIGNAVTVVWVGDLLVGDRGGRVGGTAALVGAVVLACLAAIPLLGNLIISVLGFFGLGVVSRGLYESWSG